MTLTECLPGYVHSHVVLDRTKTIRYAVCQRCHKTLHFSQDNINRRVGWALSSYVIQEWP